MVANGFLEEFSPEPAIRDVPEFDCGVVTGRGNEVVIVRTPPQGRDGGSVTHYPGVRRGHSTMLEGLRANRDLQKKSHVT